MAKKQEQMLTEGDVEKGLAATGGQTGGGALAVPENLKGGAIIEGEEDGPVKIAVLKLHQGTAKETKQFGPGFAAGDFIDTLENIKIPDPKVMIVGGYKEWVRFDEGSNIPAYRFRKRSEVPVGDLATRDDAGNDIRSKAVETLNAIVVVDGYGWPFLFRFKRSGMSCYSKSIEPMEKRRNAMERGPGAYMLGSTEQEKAGNPYQQLTAKPCEPTLAMLSLASKVKAEMDIWREKAEKADAEEAEANLPI